MKTVIELITTASNSNKVYYTFEFFPPKTPDGLTNLHGRLDRMARLAPNAIHITWGPNGSTAHSSLALAALAQSHLAIPACLHLTCTNASLELIDQVLEQAFHLGIRNILALRGDPPRLAEYRPTSHPDTPSPFHHAIDLVRYIHQKYPHSFCLGVAGYPEGSPSHSPDQELQFLKAKVDAGAHFVVSQVFYDVDRFLQWHQACRDIGIKVPIIPAIMPIQSFDSFRRLTALCNLTIPPHITNSLAPIKADDAAIKSYGLTLSLQMIRSLLAHHISAFHVCTLNLEHAVTRLLTILKWPPTPAPSPKLPPPGLRVNWDEFPNGRFGDPRSPAFGTLDTYRSVLPSTSHGRPTSEGDLTDIFVAYAKALIPSTPWSVEPLSPESSPITDSIVKLNASGLWTVSSQPAVNGVPSTDPSVGFGPQGGLIYQKAFVEFFVSSDQLEKLIKAIDQENSKADQVGLIKFLAGRKNDDSNQVKSNMAQGETNAITWGVFRAAEVATSTMIELSSFKAWKDEAFGIWEEWAYTFEIGSPTRHLLNRMAHEKWLCTIVHHDYVVEQDALWNFLVNNI